MPTDTKRPGMYRKPLHERLAEQRASSLRIINETADRLREVLGGYINEDEGVIPRERLLEEACYIAGIEGDYYEDEG